VPVGRRMCIMPDKIVSRRAGQRVKERKEPLVRET
jgi:hypothetical protein